MQVVFGYVKNKSRSVMKLIVGAALSDLSRVKLATKTIHANKLCPLRIERKYQTANRYKPITAVTKL